MLQLKTVTKDYAVGDQKVHALKGITVDFRKNEFVSVLGPSGCGKTTLMNIIGGLDKYTTGDLIINGKSTKDFSDGEWDNYRNKRIGFVFQSYNLIPHLDVRGNVEIALTISGISREERKNRVDAALAEVGLIDQVHQRPNQLSGGQMQRVAIARALVNSPEVLLADEPTGALDTETSTHIMNLIKKIAENRLVIMVTHNPELAEQYSTRIIKMIDGKITDDSFVYDAASDRVFLHEIEQAKATAALNKQAETKKKKEKSAMSFWTALTLSRKNLFTKKGRTILTSIAGSIGIIGIALILALSGGLNNYITRLQRDTLASNPITITSTTINMSQAMNAMGQREVFEQFPSAKKIYVEKARSMADMMTKNNISEEYLTYLDANLDLAWYNDIIYKTGLQLNIYGVRTGETAYSYLNLDGGSSGGMGNPMAGMMGGSSSTLQMMPKSDFVRSQYDILEGKFPENKNEIVIIVSDTNQIPEEMFVNLGIKDADGDTKEYSFADILGTKYKLVKNELRYSRIANGSFRELLDSEIDYEAAETLEIVGILRINEQTDGGVLSTGIGYLKELYTWLQSENGDSDIIAYMNNPENALKDPIGGVAFTSDAPGNNSATKEEKREAAYRTLGGNSLPNEISIYPVSFDAKESIKTILSEYNTGRDKDDMVTYTDMAEMLGDTLSSMVDIISYVLIAFTAISLIVSSIMIAIITYVSVLERTKEIGILRSIGARKKDISRVFNAETIIIGLIAGLIGVLITYLLSIPINVIIKALVGISGIASLNIGYAVILICISILLTLLSGYIPAKKAAKKDPVTALRTE